VNWFTPECFYRSIARPIAQNSVFGGGMAAEWGGRPTWAGIDRTRYSGASTRPSL
jgi:hypothetical protein